MQVQQQSLANSTPSSRTGPKPASTIMSSSSHQVYIWVILIFLLETGYTLATFYLTWQQVPLSDDPATKKSSALGLGASAVSTTLLSSYM